MAPGRFLWFQVGFMDFHLDIHGSGSVFHDSRLVFMVLEWFIPELSLGGVK